MRTVAIAVVLVTTALLASGCAAGATPEQRAAAAAVERHVRGLDGYDAGDIHCTRNPRPWFVEQPTRVYICTVQRDDGDCDWFRVSLVERSVDVTLDTRRGGCVLPL